MLGRTCDTNDARDPVAVVDADAFQGVPRVSLLGVLGVSTVGRPLVSNICVQYYLDSPVGCGRPGTAFFMSLFEYLLVSSAPRDSITSAPSFLVGSTEYSTYDTLSRSNIAMWGSSTDNGVSHVVAS